jgi:WD40 repeat protein
MKIEEKLTLIFIWLNLYNLGKLFLSLLCCSSILNFSLFYKSAKNEASTSSKKYKIFTDVNVNESDWQQFLTKQFISLNKLQCLAECQKNPDCNLISFNKINNYCKLYSDYLSDEETNLIASKGNMIYKPIINNLRGVVYKQTSLNYVSIISIVQVSNKNIACGLQNGKIIILSHVDLSFIRNINAHSMAVYSMDNLKNGYLVSGSDDSTIKIWDHSTGTLINTLIGHTNVVYIVKVLSNNDIASGSTDNTVRIWNSSTGLTKMSFTQHTSIVWDLSELSNNRIASLDLNGNIKIWNYLNGSLISSFNTGFQRCLTILKNGDYAIGALNSGSLGIYDATTFNLKHNLIGHTQAVNKIIQLENEDLCSCSDDETIKCWDWNTKKLKFNLVGHTSILRSIIQLYNEYLASAGIDSAVIIWK